MPWNRRSVVLLALLTACGGGGESEASSESSSADRSSGGEIVASSQFNLPASVWERTDVLEAGLSLETPGPARRQVATTDTSRTFEYIIDLPPLAVAIDVELFSALITPAAEPAALDAVGTELARRLTAPERGCTSQPVDVVTVAGRSGRRVVGTACSHFGGGTMTMLCFPHGRALITVIALGTGLDAGSVVSVLDRIVSSVSLGEAPSWFAAVDTTVQAPNVPGLSFMLPAGATSRTVESDEGTSARFTAEPIRGIALVATVSTPATTTASAYCDAFARGGHLELVDQRAHPTFCEVRGRRVGSPELYEIHHVLVVGGAVIDFTWAGPLLPEFIPGGEAQLEQVRGSLRLAAP